MKEQFCAKKERQDCTEWMRSGIARQFRGAMRICRFFETSYRYMLR